MDNTQLLAIKHLLGVKSTFSFMQQLFLTQLAVKSPSDLQG